MKLDSQERYFDILWKQLAIQLGYNIRANIRDKHNSIFEFPLRNELCRQLYDKLLLEIRSSEIS